MIAAPKLFSPIFFFIALVSSQLATADDAEAKDNPPTIEYEFALNYGLAQPDVNNVSRNEYMESLGIAPGLRLTAAKPVRDNLRLIGSVEANLSLSSQIVGGNSISYGYMAGLGVTYGRITLPDSYYATLLAGYSAIEIGESGEEVSDNGCPAFVICFNSEEFRRGARSAGLGYRISIGKVQRWNQRIEFSYSRLGGDADSIGENVTAFLSFYQVSMVRRFK